MAKSKAKAKAEKLPKMPPNGTRFIGYKNKEHYRVIDGRLMMVLGDVYRDDTDLLAWVLDRDGDIRQLPPTKPARDSMSMRRKAVAGVLGGWVVGTKKLHSFGITHEDGTIDANVKVTISAKNYAKFIADPEVGGRRHEQESKLLRQGQSV